MAASGRYERLLKALVRPVRGLDLKEFRFARAQQLSLFLVVVAIVVVAVTAAENTGAGFIPRNAAIDGMAGLVFAAFIVDRLLPFIPPVLAQTGTGTAAMT